MKASTVSMGLVALVLAGIALLASITAVSNGLDVKELETALKQTQASRDQWREQAMDTQDAIADLQAKQAATQIFEGINNEDIRKVEGTLMVYTTTGKMVIVDVVYDPNKPDSTLELN